jgi:hypothetical protein
MSTGGFRIRFEGEVPVKVSAPEDGKIEEINRLPGDVPRKFNVRMHVVIILQEVV